MRFILSFVWEDVIIIPIPREENFALDFSSYPEVFTLHMLHLLLSPLFHPAISFAFLTPIQQLPCEHFASYLILHFLLSSCHPSYCLSSAIPLTLGRVARASSRGIISAMVTSLANSQRELLFQDLC